MCQTNRAWLVVVLAIYCLPACSPGREKGTEAHLSESSTLPNIVLILADDLGFSDVGAFGGEIDTPNINGLASEGLRFAQFYNAARCVPTRASLLTGHYPHQAGLGHMNYDAGEPGYRGTLNRATATMAEALGAGGYQTHMAGKWHVAASTAPGSDPSNWPRQRGFDTFFGTLPGHGSLYAPAGLMSNDEFIDVDVDFFYTDAISSSAADYIQRAAKSEQPFFLYVAYTAPHYPLHARPETIQKYDGVYDGGWDVIRESRRTRLTEFGLLQPESLPSDPANIPWADEKNKEWQSKRMQAYAAMVDEMDQGIGVIVDALRESGADENTLVIFLSDNGGSAEGHLNNTIERKDIPWTSSVIPKVTRDGRPVVPGDIPGLAPGPEDTYGSYGIRWASVSNAPFRRHKSWVHEGGISTPMIVRWPSSNISRGSVTKEIGHIIDLMPTFLEAANVPYSSVSATDEPISLPGRSLLPLLEGDALPERCLYWEHEGNRAVRCGKWKLVSEFPGTWSTFYAYEKQGDWELYDMTVDRSEQFDLSEKLPDVVQELVTLYDNWAAKNLVIKWDQLEGREE